MGLFGPPNVEKLKRQEDVSGLVKALRYRQWGYRCSAAKALGELGDEAAVEPLIAALSDVAPAVQGAAARALGELGDEAAVEPLIAALIDGAPAVQGPAAAALGRLGDARAIEPLIAALGVDKTDAVRDAARLAVDEQLLTAEPISRERMDLLWLDPPRLRELEASLTEDGSTTFSILREDDTGMREHQITAADIEFAKRLEGVVIESWQAPRSEQSLIGYRKGLRLASGCDLFLMSVGAGYANLGRAARGLRFLERAAEISPDNQRIARNLAQGRATSPGSRDLVGGVVARDELLAGLLGQRCPCPSCGASIEFEEGVQRSWDAHGVPAPAAMCTECNSIFEVELAAGGMRMTDDLTATFRSGVTRQEELYRGWG